MKTVLGSFVVLLIVCIYNNAFSVNIEWTFPVDQESTISGFILFDSSHNIVVDNIPVNLRYGSFTATTCGSWYMRPYTIIGNYILLGEPSNQAFWCPPIDFPEVQTAPEIIGITN